MYVFLGVATVVATYIAAKLIGSIAIFPGQIFANVQDLKNIKFDEGLDVSFSEEKTKDNRILQTVKITPPNPLGDVIIIFNGQNATFRNEKKLKTYCQLAKDTKHTVIGFDYGGTGLKRITTWSSQALINDGFHLALQVSKTMGKNNALILKGNSLGGAIATKVAKRCHDSKIKAYLWNGRSFKSASAVIAGQIQTLHLSGHYENTLTKKLSSMTQPIASLLLRLTQFEMNVSEDYKNISSEYKNYYIVRSNMKQRQVKKDDVMIPHWATLESDCVIKEDAKKTIVIGNKFAPTDIAYFRSRRKITSESSKMLIQCQKQNYFVEMISMFLRTIFFVSFLKNI
ncbi:sidB homolog, substrate of the Dot/Icm system [Legionella beliardensis]|uniref:SidB homolog, substrate of the Dot/Icm system n=1 Tax=Legionella beliardensis TaxID=91822 RepID=A0A378JNX2_9GAMM|nr:hypothetical protein [Legionella beliardensis]STX55472.1 sidB homolog, substrate of the Dot/Icm system [Legionella beliardensis]